MNQKTLAIVAIAVIAVAAIGGAAYWYYYMQPEPEPEPEPTGIEDATSLTFTVDIIGGDNNGTYVYNAKNIGTSDMMIRVDIPVPAYDMTIIYIVDQGEQKAWGDEGAGWTDLSSDFQIHWDAWESTFSGYTDKLATWESGDWEYTDTDGSAVTIYDITVDPTLADSLFAPPA